VVIVVTVVVGVVCSKSALVREEREKKKQDNKRDCAYFLEAQTLNERSREDETKVCASLPHFTSVTGAVWSV